jgi:hypothetical protein
VHYTTWAEATGEELENTRESREAAQIIVAQGALSLARSQRSADPRALACSRADAARSRLRRADAAHRAGLGLALLSMAPGERALVRCGAAGAYGDAGNFSFPAVAPRAALLYDVELLSVETATAAHDVKARACSRMRLRMRMRTTLIALRLLTPRLSLAP